MLPLNLFFNSTLPVSQNAVKNVLFRASGIILSFAVYRFFALLAFHRHDYTTFLMYAEDFIQKGLFIADRRFNRQSLLIIAFTIVTVAAGFYDTLIWAVDSPGYLLRTTRVSAGILSAKMLPSPAYVTFIASNISDADVEGTLGTNLYSVGFNFSLPGINQLESPEVVPEQTSLSTEREAPRIWLDTDGFAVGLDQTLMWGAGNGCMAENIRSSVASTQLQAWACATNNSNSLDIFDYPVGMTQVWWDLEHADFIVYNRNDNPWFTLQKQVGSAFMKQVFTVTKGTRRHTFLQTTLKTTILGAPELKDSEITDIINRTWSTASGNEKIFPDMTVLVNLLLEAKANSTSYVLGAFAQQNTSVSSISAELLNVPQSNLVAYAYSALRTVVTSTVLISSETLASPPIPFESCSLVYRNVATGGTVRSSNCNTAGILENQLSIPTSGLFLGQVDTSALVLMTDIIGDGTSNTSAVALNHKGAEWYIANADKLNRLLISRALIVGGAQDRVMVDTTDAVSAISYLQVLLIMLPIMLLLAVTAFTLGKPMSYYGSSFLSVVFATTHITTDKCHQIGYIRRVPEVEVGRVGDHYVLKTPHGGTISNVAGQNISGMLSEPLLLGPKDDRGQWGA